MQKTGASLPDLTTYNRFHKNALSLVIYDICFTKLQKVQYVHTILRGVRRC